MSYENAYSNLVDFNKSLFAPFVKSATLFSQFGEHLARQQLGLANELISTQFDSYLKEAEHTKEVKDIFALNTKIARENAGKCLDYTQKTVELFVDFSGKVNKLVEENLVHVAEHQQVFAQKAAVSAKPAHKADDKR